MEAIQPHVKALLEHSEFTAAEKELLLPYNVRLATALWLGCSYALTYMRLGVQRISAVDLNKLSYSKSAQKRISMLCAAVTRAINSGSPAEVTEALEFVRGRVRSAQAVGRPGLLTPECSPLSLPRADSPRGRRCAAARAFWPHRGAHSKRAAHLEGVPRDAGAPTCDAGASIR